MKDSSESTAWTVPELLRTVALRGQHPAVIVSGAEGVAVSTCEAIAKASMALARRLRRDGIDHSKRMALWAYGLGSSVASSACKVFPGAWSGDQPYSLSAPILQYRIHRSTSQMTTGASRRSASASPSPGDIVSASPLPHIDRHTFPSDEPIGPHPHGLRRVSSADDSVIRSAAAGAVGCCGTRVHGGRQRSIDLNQCRLDWRAVARHLARPWGAAMSRVGLRHRGLPPRRAALDSDG